MKGTWTSKCFISSETRETKRSVRMCRSWEPRAKYQDFPQAGRLLCPPTSLKMRNTELQVFALGNAVQPKHLKSAADDCDNSTTSEKLGLRLLLRLC